MILSSWYWAQFLLGVFPFRLCDKTQNIPMIKFSYYGVVFLILNIICEFAELKFVIGVYTDPGTEPQILSCLYNSLGIIYIILLRLFKVKEYISLHDIVLKEIESEHHLLNHVLFHSFQLFCSTLTTIIVYRRFKNFMFLVISIKTTICQLSPLFVEDQYSLICSILQQSMHKINKNIQSGNNITKPNLRYFKSRHTKLFSLFQKTIRFYSIDLFYTISSGGLRIFIIMNDLILLSFLKLPYHYKISMVYFTVLLIFLVIRIWWVCFRSVNFVQEAANTSTILCKYNQEFLDNSTLQELILWQKQLSRRSIEVNAFGFFNLNMGLLFEGLGLVATFVVIFIQLIQIQRLDTKY